MIYKSKNFKSKLENVLNKVAMEAYICGLQLTQYLERKFNLNSFMSKERRSKTGGIGLP